MADERQVNVDFDDESDEQDTAQQLGPAARAAVVTGTDWTTETIVSQLRKGNIGLNPRFQRRDAWKRDRKGRFIESLIVGLPIPQIVLAESQGDRGKFIVLDGKQRLLSVLQYWGEGTGPNNGFALSGLTLRADLNGLTFNKLSSDSAYEADYTALCNQPIRTVVIRDWKDTSFLHTVFLRLNTGSVSLSPQELRQALLPGAFSDFVDDAAGTCGSLQALLGVVGPDPRMRDIEILARFLAFRFFAEGYPGRMKEFLDSAFAKFNLEWGRYSKQVEAAVEDFDRGVQELIATFGDQLARKPGSSQFNRAIFDALIYFHSKRELQESLRTKRKQVSKAYQSLFLKDSGFVDAVESDTAGAPNTSARVTIWARALSGILNKPVRAPEIPTAAKHSTRRSAGKKVSRSSTRK